MSDFDAWTITVQVGQDTPASLSIDVDRVIPGHRLDREAKDLLGEQVELHFDPR